MIYQWQYLETATTSTRSLQIIDRILLLANATFTHLKQRLILANFLIVHVISRRTRRSRFILQHTTTRLTRRPITLLLHALWPYQPVNVQYHVITHPLSLSLSPPLLIKKPLYKKLTELKLKKKLKKNKNKRKTQTQNVNKKQQSDQRCRN